MMDMAHQQAVIIVPPSTEEKILGETSPDPPGGDNILLPQDFLTKILKNGCWGLYSNINRAVKMSVREFL